MILVVGGLGYIGSVLVPDLRCAGYRVEVLDRGYFRCPDGHVRQDMRMPIDNLDQYDCVVNLGGLSNDPTADYNPEANIEMNTIASVKLAEQARAAGVKSYVYASTCSIYDTGTDNEEETICTEETPVSPNSNYAGSKREAEKFLLEIGSEDFRVVCLRKGTVFGWSPRMRLDLVVSSFINDAVNHGRINVNNYGRMWRPMLGINDASHAYQIAIKSNISGIYNAVTCNVRVSDLAIQVANTLRDEGIKCEIVGNDISHNVRSYRVSASKLKKEGFEPVDTIEESVRMILHNFSDWNNPRCKNITWMKILDEAAAVLGTNRRSHECI